MTHTFSRSVNRQPPTRYQEFLSVADRCGWARNSQLGRVAAGDDVGESLDAFVACLTATSGRDQSTSSPSTGSCPRTTARAHRPIFGRERELGETPAFRKGDRREGPAALRPFASWTPIAAAPYGARPTGRTPSDALADVLPALPRVNPNRGQRAALERL